ncbi:MAG: hypothetical protein IKJ34_07440 [Mailhella sp.]|nr:hypothetical protein [Mailhella sp.]
MKAFFVRMKAEEPLVITSGSSESMAHETLGYVPGNMLLGAFASVWKRSHPEDDPDSTDDFRRLFLDGDISWGTAFPLCGNDAGVPIPRSYMRVKNHKGLPHIGESADGHIVVNLLRMKDEDNCTQLLRDKKIIGSADVPKLKKFSASFMGRDNLRLPEEKRGWNIHVALGSQRSALDGQLFGYSSIAAGTEFLSCLVCKDEKTEQTLRDLLNSTRVFRVGRSRSAGYGKVRLLSFYEEYAGVDSLTIREGNSVAIFLRSHYVASSSWLLPVESLLADIEQLCGARPELKKLFCTYSEIQGYNAMWRKPRPSRTVLEQGSVLLCSFDKDVQLPRHIMLGADQIEGYGRIELDPSFLDETLPQIPHESINSRKSEISAPQASPMWKNIRRRALEQLCEERAYALLLDDAWQKFIDSVSRSAHPTASQRGNIRRIVTELPQEAWQGAFRSMLSSNARAEDQWKNAVALSPFSKRNEYLEGIMSEILSAERAESFRPGENPPGGPASASELLIAEKEAHRLFMLRLLSAWGHSSRDNEEGRN